MEAKVRIPKGHRRLRKGERVRAKDLWFDNHDMTWNDFVSEDYGIKLTLTDYKKGWLVIRHCPYGGPIEPREAEEEAQGKESDGPQGSPLNASIGMAYNGSPMDFDWVIRSLETLIRPLNPNETGILRQEGLRQFVNTLRQARAALNAERSDAPSPNPPPNPLETAEQVIVDQLFNITSMDSAKMWAKEILEVLESKGFGITRTGGRA